MKISKVLMLTICGASLLNSACGTVLKKEEQESLTNQTGEVSFALDANAIPDNQHSLFVSLTDSQGQVHKRSLAKGGEQVFFGSLPQGEASVEAHLLNGSQVVEKGSGKAVVKQGQKAELFVTLIPVVEGGGGLLIRIGRPEPKPDIVIGRPEPKPDTPVMRPERRSLLGVKLPASGLVVLLQHSGADTTKWSSQVEVRIKGPKVEASEIIIRECNQIPDSIGPCSQKKFPLSDDKKIAQAVEILNKVSTPDTTRHPMIACLPPPGPITSSFLISKVQGDSEKQVWTIQFRCPSDPFTEVDFRIAEKSLRALAD